MSVKAGTKKSKPSQVNSFFSYINSRSQKRRMLVFFGFYLIVYFVLTHFYPFPNGISDSGAYVNAAMANKYDGYRPFGYSSFLISVHNISSSLSALVFIQYWFHVLSVLFFILTVKYMFRPASRLSEILFEVLAICSLSVIFLTNCVLSDSLFTTLTTLWLAFGLWFVYTQKTAGKIFFFLCHLLLLGFLMNVRHTGLFYAGISFIVVFISLYRFSKSMAFGFTILPVFVVSMVYINQRKATEELTTIDVFNGFSGWQMANNALHVLPFIELDTNDIKEYEVRNFASFAKSLDTAIVKVLPENNTSASFLWNKKSPLKLYLAKQIPIKRASYMYTWTYLGANVYAKFGSYIFWNHPGAYIKHFLWPNFLSAVYPQNDQLYNVFKVDAVPAKLMQSWFEVPAETKIEAKTAFVKNVSGYMPGYRLVLWLLSVVSFVYCFFRFRKSASILPFQKGIFWFVSLFLFGYLAFHTYSVPFELRYSAPIHLAQVFMVFLGLNTLIQGRKQAELK